MFNLFKKKDRPIQDSAYQEDLHEDISDSASSTKKINEDDGFNDCKDDSNPQIFDERDKPDLFEGEKSEEEINAEYIKTANEFIRLNNDQVSDKEKRTEMKKRKNKTLFGSLSKGLKEQYYAFKDSLSSSGSDSNRSIVQFTNTENEKNYKGLNKTYIYGAIGIFCLVVMSGLIFANDEKPQKPQRQSLPEEATNVSNSGNRNDILLNIPQSYGENLEIDKEDKDKKDDTLKVPEEKNKKAPTPPSVPKQPNGKADKRIEREKSEAFKIKEAAINSNISFKISNEGIK